MPNQQITKSGRKLEAWAEVRALDAIAIPLIARMGLAEAYRIAIEEKSSAAASRVVRETLCATAKAR